MGILDGKVVLITGAASGIGRATALEAHREGARLLSSGINADGGQALCTEIGADAGEAIFSTCDVTSGEAVESLIAQALSEPGALDCAFNCAATLGAHQGHGPRGLAPYPRRRPERRLPLHEARAPSDGRAGIRLDPQHGLTRAAALEFAAQGVRVNAICPSYTKTPMVDDLFENLLGGDPAQVDAAGAKHPIGRFADAAEIAPRACGFSPTSRRTSPVRR
jgi:NAD(P)-dependent dehydrogenase (short-subunit alcohol dehydrogenase family)